jgi:transcription antitermination factor NusG
LESLKSMQPSDSDLAARHASAAVLPLLPAEFLETRWYAAYTNPRHEKHVAVQMDSKCIECFVPLYRSVRRWRDRRKELELPLFPGYVFVHIALRDRLQVLQLPGVAHFVSFHGKPAPLPTVEIEALRNGLVRNTLAEPHPYLRVGRRVRIHSGPMAGMQGVLVRRKDKFRVVLSVHLIQRSVAVEVDEAEIEPIR